jgi:hypothetical protein
MLFRFRAVRKLLRFSDSFPDAAVLLAECIRLGLEGAVCKRKDATLSVGLAQRVDQSQD